MRCAVKNRESHYNTVLRGAPLSAAEDAVIAFHRPERDENGNPVNISFNFAERSIFERDDTLCDGAVAERMLIHHRRGRSPRSTR